MLSKKNKITANIIKTYKQKDGVSKEGEKRNYNTNYLMQSNLVERIKKAGKSSRLSVPLLFPQNFNNYST